MLKIFITIFVAVVCAVNGAPVDGNHDDDSLYEIYIPNNRQSYRYQYELEDGQKQSQVGYFKYVDKDRPLVWVVEGFYSFIATDGKTYSVEYIADENGYRAKVKYPSSIEQPPQRPKPPTIRPPPLPPSPPPTRPPPTRPSPPPTTYRPPSFVEEKPDPISSFGNCLLSLCG